MRCRKVKELLGRYQAGECRSSEAGEISEHLAGCGECSKELEDLRQIDYLLDLWQPDPAPRDLLNAVMENVALSSRRAGHTLPTMPEPQKAGFPVTMRKPYTVFFDVVTAAAVCLALAWGLGPRLDGVEMTDTGKGVNAVVSSYVRTTDNVVTRATVMADEYSQRIFTK
ncbi:MAG: zf-HC2 domain-containing protein [Bacillota bacterium]